MILVLRRGPMASCLWIVVGVSLTLCVVHGWWMTFLQAVCAGDRFQSVVSCMFVVHAIHIQTVRSSMLILGPVAVGTHGRRFLILQSSYLASPRTR